MVLEEINKLGLVEGFRAGEQRSTEDGVFLLLGSEIIKLASGIRLASEILSLLEYSDLAADRLGGGLVVTSDDDDADAGLPAGANGSRDFRAGGVKHGNNTNEGEVLLVN
jgi:hypothetical protein